MAFNVDVNLSKLEGLQEAIKNAQSGFEKHIIDMLNIIGWKIHPDALEMILKGPTRHGREYRNKKGQLTTRSAWGEPAKNDTGNLAGSLEVQLFGSNAVKVGYLESLAPYGEDLEDPAKLNRPVLVTVKGQNMAFIKAQIKRTAQKITKL